MQTVLALPRYSRHQWWVAIALFIACFIGGLIGIGAYQAPSIIFPAAGIALGVLTLEGIELWPAIALGVIAAFLPNNPSPVFLVFFTVAYTLSAVIGAWLLRRFGFNCYLRRLRDIITFFVVIGATSAIVPAIGFIGILLDERFYHVVAPVYLTPGTWWLGIITSNILIAPLVMRWGIKPYFSRTRQETLQLAGAFAVFFLVAITLSWTTYTSIFGISLIYFLLLPFFWLALRSGPRFLSVMFFLFFVIFYTGVMWGSSAASPAVLGSRLFQSEMLFDILAAVFYIVVAIEEERKEALRVLSAQIHRLENVLDDIEGQNRAKTDFLAMLAHELRNPLAPVVSSIELLRVRQWVAEEGTPLLDVMEDSLRVIRRHLDDLLDVSRISQNKLTLRKEPFHVGFAARRAVKVLEKRLEDERQKVEVDLPKIPLMIEADPVRIEQVFLNLVGNASKFTPQGGMVVVTVRPVGGMAEIRVRDTGIGIDPSMLERIFDPFVQLDRSGAQEGLGIGLALTRQLVEVHGGTIEAHSDGRGKGSEFIVRLPLSLAARISEGEMRQEPSAGDVSQTRRAILVVDDNATAARAVGALLEHDGHAIEYANSAAEARRKVPAFRPDAIILDIGLPDMSGYDLARVLRGEGFAGKLVALSGYGQEEDKRRARESGFDLHLTKPVALRDLRSALVS